MRPTETSERIHFNAPLSTGLKVSTAIVTVLVVGASTGGAITLSLVTHSLSAWLGILVVVTGPLALLVTALFAVHGYELKHDALYVQRPLWHTRISLRGLREATADAGAMGGAIKVCGCSGFLCYVGWFTNRRLGRFRACATDANRAVVLRFRDRTWVVTPDDPEQFIARIKEKAGLAA
jgi:hypothetical protein